MHHDDALLGSIQNRSDSLNRMATEASARLSACAHRLSAAGVGLELVVASTPLVESMERRLYLGYGRDPHDDQYRILAIGEEFLAAGPVDIRHNIQWASRQARIKADELLTDLLAAINDRLAECLGIDGTARGDNA